MFYHIYSLGRAGYLNMELRITDILKVKQLNKRKAKHFCRDNNYISSEAESRVIIISHI